MSTLTREQLTSGSALKHETMDVPELGGGVNVYELAPRQRMDFYRWLRSVTPAGQTEPDVMSITDFRERLLTLALRDDERKLIFQPDDVALIGDTLPDDVLTRLADLARRLSGIGDDTIEEKAVELPNAPDASAS